MDTKKLILLKHHFRTLANRQGYIGDDDYHKACEGLEDQALLTNIGDWIVTRGFVLRRGIGEQYKQDVLNRVKNPNVDSVKDTKHRTHKNKDKLQKSKAPATAPAPVPESTASMNLNKSIEQLQDYKDEFLPAWKKFKAALAVNDWATIEALQPILAQYGEGTPYDIIKYGVDRLTGVGLSAIYIPDIPGVSNTANLANARELENLQIADLDIDVQRNLGARINEIVQDPNGALTAGLYLNQPIGSGVVSEPREMMPTSVDFENEIELEEGEPMELAPPFYTGSRRLHLSAAEKTGYTSQERAKLTFANGVSFTAFIADSPAKKAAGLEVFSELGEQDALYFPFEETGTVTFHMGSVQFPIDIVFLMPSPNGMEIGKVVSDAKPGSPDWWSSRNTAAVLEVAGGTCKKAGLKVGDTCAVSHRIVADEFDDGPEVNESILEGIARAIFVFAWADEAEEAGQSFSGMDVMEVAPPTSPEAMKEARALYSEIEQSNNIDLATFVPPGLGDVDWPGPSVENEFGHYLALEALGHGAAWSDDWPEHGLTIPHIEPMLDSSLEEEYPTPDEHLELMKDESEPEDEDY